MQLEVAIDGAETARENKDPREHRTMLPTLLSADQRGGSAQGVGTVTCWPRDNGVCIVGLTSAAHSAQRLAATLWPNLPILLNKRLGAYALLAVVRNSMEEYENDGWEKKTN